MSEEYTFTAWKRKIGINRIPLGTVKFTRQGQLKISEDLFERHFSLEFSGIEVFIDAEKKSVGIKPSNDKENGFPFMTPKHGRKANVVNLLKFCVLNNIDPKQYPARWSEKHGMLIFNYQTLEENPKP